MADLPEGDLAYGHFGHADYDVEEREWAFTRKFEQDILLKPIGEAKVVIPSPQGTSSPSNHYQTIVPSRRREHQVQSLARAHPQVQPASSLLPSLLRTSEALEAAIFQYDPARGDLLAFGTIPSQADRHFVNIAAFPVGPSGSDLRLVQVHKERQGWADSKAAWIEVPSINGEVATWHGEGAPIQQICFAHAFEGSDMFLAVRMITKTLIFRPHLRAAPVHGAFGSRIHIDCVCELGIDSNRKIPHADATFNPWYNRQFATVDQAGHFSVWELEGRVFQSVLVCQGSMPHALSNQCKPTADGWARILWVSNLTTILVCTRSGLSMYMIKGKAPVWLQDIDFGLNTGMGWLLELRMTPKHLELSFALTTTHIMVDRFISHDDETTSVGRLMRIRHFRNPDDPSLQIRPFVLQNTILLLLCSGIEDLITRYTLDLTEAGHVSTSDPVSLSLPVISCSPANCITGIEMHSSEYLVRQEAKSGPRMALRYRDRGIRFVTFTVLLRDFSLHQQLFWAISSRHSRIAVQAPTWEAATRTSGPRLKREGFVVDDEETDDAALEPPVLAPLPPIPNVDRAGTASDWTVNYERLSTLINGAHEVEKRPCAEIIDHGSEMLRTATSEGMVPLRTMAELDDCELMIEDLEDASLRLDAVADVRTEASTLPGEASQASQPLRLVLRSLQRAPGLDANGTQGRLSILYKAMVADWISPLPMHTPGRLRLAKDQAIRNAAAQVALSSNVLRIELREELADPNYSQAQPWELPLRSVPSASHPSTASFLDTSSQVPSQQTVSHVPTPSSSRSQSVTTVPSDVSHSVALGAPGLIRYTTFSKPLPLALPRSLERVLSHWKVNEDPSNYDWLSTSRRISEQDEPSDEEVTEKDRARAQRRAARHERRQRREAVASQAAQAASSQAAIISASQPLQVVQSESLPTGAVGSSQTQGIGTPSASQVVRGRFGGRPPAKKRRKQGF